jgi:hypothetical protein
VGSSDIGPVCSERLLESGIDCCRIMRLGNTIKSTATKDPDPSSMLPVDDAVWDRGV